MGSVPRALIAERGTSMELVTLVLEVAGSVLRFVVDHCIALIFVFGIPPFVLFVRREFKRVKDAITKPSSPDE
jgi:hypothetical protein